MNAWVKLQFIIFAVILAILIGYMAYAAHMGKLEGSAYRSIYIFFKKPSWSRWKDCYAAIVSDVWGDMLLTFLFMTIPVPSTKVVVYLELMLLKITLYKLSIVFTVGKPEYNPEKKVPTSDQVGIWIFLGLSILIVIVTRIVTDSQSKRKSDEREGTFRKHIEKVLEPVATESKAVKHVYFDRSLAEDKEGPGPNSLDKEPSVEGLSDKQEFHH